VTKLFYSSYCNLHYKESTLKIQSNVVANTDFIQHHQSYLLLKLYPDANDLNRDFTYQLRFHWLTISA